MSNKYYSTKKELCVSCGEMNMRLDMFQRYVDKKWFCRKHLIKNNTIIFKTHYRKIKCQK